MVRVCSTCLRKTGLSGMEQGKVLMQLGSPQQAHLEGTCCHEAARSIGSALKNTNPCACILLPGATQV